MNPSGKLDKKNAYLVLAVWLAPVLVSLYIDLWWVDSIAGLISLSMGIFVLFYWTSRGARVMAIVMIISGILNQGSVIIRYHFGALSK